ncbi:MAG TPA: ROK family protein [Gemmatimonadaceae bacterium]|nr:ROK family protein [Gemmatimonadaceae bacterium]
MAKSKLRIGVDLGGTKIEAIAMGSDGREIVRHRVATPPGYEQSVEAIAKLVEEVEKKAGRAGTVGIGIPGIVVPDTGLVKNANSVWLNGQPLARDLEQRLSRPIRVMNDADCFALSEATDGAAAGAGVVFGVIIGTGVGGGIVVDGRCLAGANLIAGEWGHNPLPWMDTEEFPGPSCYCGRMGCIEMWVSGPGFERDHARRAGATQAASEIVKAAVAGDPIASMSLNLYCDRLGRSLASLVNVLDPEVIVLGGGMSNVPDLPRRVAEVVPRYILAAGATSARLATKFVCAMHGDSSGVRGAARLWGR